MSVAIATAQGESYVYGGVLFQRVRESKPQRASLVTCLSQGFTTGAILMFLAAAGFLLYDYDNGYNFLVVAVFPFYLCSGILPGLVVGLVIWICTRLTGHNLRLFTRSLIAALVFAIPYVAMQSIYSSSYGRNPRVSQVLVITLIVGALGAIYGILTGSRVSPWHCLVRGDNSLPAGSWFVTGLTGLVLRIAVVFFLMEAILACIVVLQQEFRQSDFLWVLSLLLHFIFAFAIVFTRSKFSLLLPLALVASIPVGVFLKFYLLNEAWDLFIYLCVGYLGAWALFLIARSPLTYWTFDFLKEEVKYYLID